MTQYDICMYDKSHVHYTTINSNKKKKEEKKEKISLNRENPSIKE